MRFSKAVVAAPPVRDFYFTPARATALGARSVADQLGKLGIEAEVINFPLINPRGRGIPLAGCYNYLKPYMIQGERGPLAFFTGRKLYGPSFSEAARMIARRNPEIIFISLFAWTYGDDALSLAAELKKITSVPLILGGAGAAVYPGYFRRSGLFDALLTGEAETAVPRFLLSPGGEPPYLSAPSEINGTEAPDPSVHFNRDSRGNQFLTMSLTRGCPKMCRFCSNFLTQGRTFRPASLERLEERLAELPIDRSRGVHINLEDDNLLVRKSYFNDFLALMKGMYSRRTYTVHNGLDYTNLTESYADYLIDEGFSHFSLSLGSADSDVLKSEMRPGNLKKLETILRHLKTRNIGTTTFFICGLPDDRSDVIIDTLLYLHSLPTETGISLFYPVPGLPRFENLSQFDNFPPSMCSGSSAYPWGESLSTGQMVTAFRLARLSNLIGRKDKSSQEQALLARIAETGRLHTFLGKKRSVKPVPFMDEEMTSRFTAETLN